MEKQEQGMLVINEENFVIPPTRYLDVLDRLEILSQEDFDALEVKWHKSCYGTFSSESKLDRLRKQCQASSQEGPSTSHDHCCSIPSVPTRRSAQKAIDWTLCMFCQSQNKRKIHRVQTLEKSADVIERAKSDPVMSTRLSGVSDLIAAEGAIILYV